VILQEPPRLIAPPPRSTLNDNSTRADLAILLEYDPVGRRYSRQAPLKDAVAEYEKLGQDKLSELELANNLAYARFYAGDYAGACKAGQAINPEPRPCSPLALPRSKEARPAWPK